MNEVTTRIPSKEDYLDHHGYPLITDEIYQSVETSSLFVPLSWPSRVHRFWACRRLGGSAVEEFSVNRARRELRPVKNPLSLASDLESIGQEDLAGEIRRHLDSLNARSQSSPLYTIPVRRIDAIIPGYSQPED
jgi:hypothetical protein